MKERQYYYRPQTKFAKVMFLHLSVSHSVDGGGAWGYPPPPGQVHPHPPGQIHPRAGTPSLAPLYTVHAGIRSTSGQYASHWNAILFCGINFVDCKLEKVDINVEWNKENKCKIKSLKKRIQNLNLLVALQLIPLYIVH